jgi:hypothetical protein
MSIVDSSKKNIAPGMENFDLVLPVTNKILQSKSFVCIDQQIVTAKYTIGLVVVN